METDNIVRIVNSKPVKIVDSDIAAGLAKTTGWKTWGSALVAGKFLSINDELIKNKNVLDLSSGNGVVALICAALGAKLVTATECKTCIRILEKNIEFNIADETKWLTKDQIVVKQCNWGENIVDESLKNTMYDLIVLSDLVFIAVRDSIMNEFINTIIQLAKPQTQMLLIYEERILQGEAEFLDKLKEYFDFKIFELDSELLEWLESTTDDDDGGMGELFYEKPDIKIFLCKLKKNQKKKTF
jgi:predicted nicotinamide N-methyase